MNVRRYLAALGAVLLATLLWVTLAAAQEAGAAAPAPEAGQKAACTHDAGQACTAACTHAAAEAPKCGHGEAEAAGCAKKCGGHHEAEGCAKKCGGHDEAEGCRAMMAKCADMMNACAAGGMRMCLDVSCHDSGEGCVGMCLVGEGPACAKHRAAAHCGGGACPASASCGQTSCDKAACPTAAAPSCHSAPEPVTK